MRGSCVIHGWLLAETNSIGEAKGRGYSKQVESQEEIQDGETSLCKS